MKCERFSVRSFFIFFSFFRRVDKNGTCLLDLRDDSKSALALT